MIPNSGCFSPRFTELTDDRELLAQLQDPKTQRGAFEQIVRQYGEQLQNTFLKAWNGLGSFHGDAQVSTWLSRIAINESLDFLRRNKNSGVSVDDVLPVANSLMADNYFDGTEVEALLQEAVASLPDVQRVVFQLRYFEEMKYSEMSERLHTSEGALKASYHIAVKKISEFFKSHD